MMWAAHFSNEALKRDFQWFLVKLKLLLKYVIVLTDETIMKNQYGQWLRKVSAFINMDLSDISFGYFWCRIRSFIIIPLFDKYKSFKEQSNVSQLVLSLILQALFNILTLINLLSVPFYCIVFPYFKSETSVKMFNVIGSIFKLKPWCHVNRLFQFTHSHWQTFKQNNLFHHQ